MVFFVYLHFKDAFGCYFICDLTIGSILIWDKPLYGQRLLMILASENLDSMLSELLVIFW